MINKKIGKGCKQSRGFMENCNLKIGEDYFFTVGFVIRSLESLQGAMQLLWTARKFLLVIAVTQQELLALTQRNFMVNSCQEIKLSGLTQISGSMLIFTMDSVSYSNLNSASNSYTFFVIVLVSSSCSCSMMEINKNLVNNLKKGEDHLESTKKNSQRENNINKFFYAFNQKRSFSNQLHSHIKAFLLRCQKKVTEKTSKLLPQFP